MNRNDKIDFFKEFLKAEAESKANSELSFDIDKSQFELFEKPGYMELDSLPLYVSAVLEPRDTEQSVEDKAFLPQTEDLIEIAHPEPVIVAEPAVGGFVENLNEQHQAILNTVYRTPTTFPVHRMASLQIELLKIAELCDEQGFEDEADSLTVLASKIVSSAGPSAIWTFLANLTKNPAVAGGAASAIPAGLSFLFTNPYALAAMAIIAGAGIAYSQVDGMTEDIWTDIKDLQETLMSFKQDSDFASISSLDEMITLCSQISAKLDEFKTLTATAKQAGDINAADDIAKVIKSLDELFAMFQKSFSVFEVQAPKSWLRDVTGFDFEEIEGRIDAILNQYEDLKDLFAKAGSAVKTELDKTESNSPVAPGEPSVSKSPSVAGGIKEWLRSNDVSGIVGYKYILSSDSEIDSDTRKVVSDFAEAIRTHLGTKYPSTQQLLSASYMGIENVYQIYQEPYAFME